MSNVTRAQYEARLRAVYDRGEKSCGAYGPNKARCVLEPGHEGIHEGNGFDEFGPMYRAWEGAKATDE